MTSAPVHLRELEFNPGYPLATAACIGAINFMERSRYE